MNLPSMIFDRLKSGGYPSSDSLPHRRELEVLWSAILACLHPDPVRKASLEVEHGVLSLVAGKDGPRFEVRNRFQIALSGNEIGTVVLSAAASLRARLVSTVNTHRKVEVHGFNVEPETDAGPLRRR